MQKTVNNKAKYAFIMAIFIAIIGHVISLYYIKSAITPPSRLKEVAPIMYTRTLTPQEPAPAAIITTATDNTSTIKKPAVRITKNTTKKVIKKQKTKNQEIKEEEVKSAELKPTEINQEIDNEIPDGTPQENIDNPAEDLIEELIEAKSKEDINKDYLKNYPTDTRINYKLGGFYRGELHGDAKVYWQLNDDNYHISMQIDVGFLLSASFSSQGVVNKNGIFPKIYEEKIQKRIRHITLNDENIKLNNGDNIPRPDNVQDIASQLISLGHKLYTNQVSTATGTKIFLPLARPNGVKIFSYEVLNHQFIYLPKMGKIETIHLKPQDTSNKKGDITAEIWLAPSLQYLPVKVKINQQPDKELELIALDIQQK